ncbi:helix-turn-helix domain-containing protein [Paenibacillus sp. GD4]|uniref:helix-turn-helix domain-containing protein n=1 Tax=Paenibacillus sp. GD4 TaxID=3068890 RepID=UPI0027964452|nr:helix-turn-helix domain-containing protein [Paenibacillus sp. GD4]MDQ1909247.1 helix-turn-helix domain-containing protein [Paenibacillus sp. GD4]MDQ1909765.1 helix-turn-helix domain-containing protein [Paenibacillus sp. GD4]MDQ1910764.1 helix-turn-helix domain-containing protein [Paenibacillus sp. GD4]MDQ1914586.1 helix-turn-helix domain-containing protein [Paenibacillus sp. GD4]
MAIKGQKFKSYSDEMKKEAVRLHVEEKWSYRQITEHFGIQDKDRVKRWMRKFREAGEFGLLDQRGRREEYIDQDRHMKQLKRENEVLKKCLKIWKQEVCKESIASLNRPQSNIQ